MKNVISVQDFDHRWAVVEGVRLHYVEAGTPTALYRPLLLLPGWPQSWYSWRHVIPRLVESGRHVIAVDPRGFGDSDKPRAGYDMTTTAAEIRHFLEVIDLLNDGPVDVAGHDLGVWIGYALACEQPQVVQRLCLIEALLPGVTPPVPPGFPSDEANLKTWHLAFNRLDDLPELLITGRERAYLEYLFRSKGMNPLAIDRAALDEYVRVNSLPGALRAALSYYRAMFSEAGLACNTQRAETPLGMPVHALGAERGVGSSLLQTMRQVATNVSGDVVKGAGHYLIEEMPARIADELLDFFSPLHELQQEAFQ